MITTWSAEVWTAIAAGVALVLSQMPPVWQLSRWRRLELELAPLMNVGHLLGNVNLWTFIDLHNAGGLSVDVTGIDFYIVNSSAKIWQLKAQTYQSYSHPAAGGGYVTFPVSVIHLKPGESWSQQVCSYRLFSEEEEEQTTKISTAIWADIFQRRAAEKTDPQRLAEADPQLVAEAVEMFRRNFFLGKGNYRLLVGVLDANGRTHRVKGYEFTLFESHMGAAKEQTARYKYGGNVPGGATIPDIPLVRLRPIDDRAAVTAYEGLRR